MGVQIVGRRFLSGHRQPVALFRGQARPDVTVPVTGKQILDQHNVMHARICGETENRFSRRPRHPIYLQAVRTFPDAFALVHVRGARQTMPGRVRFVATASAEWMATVQLAVLAPTGFVGPAQVSRATDVGASFALRWFVAADHVNIVAHSVGDLAPIDCRRVTQFYIYKN